MNILSSIKSLFIKKPIKHFYSYYCVSERPNEVQTIREKHFFKYEDASNVFKQEMQFYADRRLFNEGVYEGGINFEKYTVKCTNSDWTHCIGIFEQKIQ